jgi:hypothetical protein
MRQVWRLRRLIAQFAFLAGFALAMPGSGAAGGSEALRLELTGETGGLRIVNLTNAAITIAPTIAVERKVEQNRGGGWETLGARFEAIGECRSYRTSPDPLAPLSAPVEIAAHAALTVVPFTGWSCQSQCPRPCRANGYYGAGRYRFVLTKLPEQKRFESPEFDLPAEPKP